MSRFCPEVADTAGSVSVVVEAAADAPTKVSVDVTV